jgi:hypothetical protein
MTQEEIIEGNNLIAQFVELDGGYTDKGYLTVVNYHRSWDWLMPVVEKIEAIRWIPPGGNDENYFRVCIDGDQCSVDRETHNSSGTIVDSWMGDKPKIERVYEVVVGFIRWYNKEK